MSTHTDPDIKAAIAFFGCILFLISPIIAVSVFSGCNEDRYYADIPETQEERDFRELKGVLENTGVWVDYANIYEDYYYESRKAPYSRSPTLRVQVDDPIRPLDVELQFGHKVAVFPIAIAKDREGYHDLYEARVYLPFMKDQKKWILRTEFDGQVWWSEEEPAQLVDGGFSVNDIEHGRQTVFVSDGKVHHGMRRATLSLPRPDAEDEIRESELGDVENIREVLNSDLWRRFKHPSCEESLEKVEQIWAEYSENVDGT